MSLVHPSARQPVAEDILVSIFDVNFHPYDIKILFIYKFLGIIKYVVLHRVVDFFMFYLLLLKIKNVID